jgi:hypothetical protein
LPLPVTLTRFLIPLWVLFLGIVPLPIPAGSGCSLSSCGELPVGDLVGDLLGDIGVGLRCAESAGSRTG